MRTRTKRSIRVETKIVRKDSVEEDILREKGWLVREYTRGAAGVFAVLYRYIWEDKDDVGSA